MMYAQCTHVMIARTDPHNAVCSYGPQMSGTFEVIVEKYLTLC